LYKELTLYFLIFTFSGCSVFKMQNENSISGKSGTNLVEIRKNNLTNNSFFVQKAEVELVSDDEKESFLASLKFCKPDSFLISIRSKTGIEAARIFITKDTLLINDRINRKLYFGSANDLERKFGYSNKLLPLIFGDFILKNANLNDLKDCREGVYTINSNYEGLNLKYIINCNSDRLVKLVVLNELETNPLVLEYSETRKTGAIYFYSKVHVKDFRGYKYLNINYKKIEIPYAEFIEFIPGKNYELVRIR